MAMTGLQIFKLLPKTNCGECGVPTCMAFAMKLAAKNAELAACPYASEEAIKTVGAASKPPIRLVKIGPPEAEVLVGNETVMFRHDKTFVHPTAIAIAFPDSEPLTELGHKIAEVRDYCLERVGEQLRVNLILIDNFSEEVKPFVDLVKAAAGGAGVGIILRSSNLEALEAGLKELAGKRPLIHAATPANADAVAALALKYNAPLVARAATIDELVALTTKLAGLGLKDIVLDLPADNPAATLQYNTILRKAALKNSFEPLGYPIINFVTALDDASVVADASDFPVQVRLHRRARPGEAGSSAAADDVAAEHLYRSAEADSGRSQGLPHRRNRQGLAGAGHHQLLPYLLPGFGRNREFGHSGEPAGGRYRRHECADGMGRGQVLGRKSGQRGESQRPGRDGKHRVIIPGYVSQISGEIEEGLPGWEVLVGPGESSDLGSFMKLQASR